jgi:hypothetical protein
VNQLIFSADAGSNAYGQCGLIFPESDFETHMFTIFEIASNNRNKEDLHWIRLIASPLST